jgi:prepilin-type processing-associated H-X9-DG protein
MSLPPGNYRGGNNVLFADGSVQFVTQTTTPQEIREMATRSKRVAERGGD